ncbi:MAG: hypothetical protein FWH14_03895 [Oscillospiraceae bacterium]|nr:hypothetical protein [Oscillospiraceae bacterium]
MKYKIGDIVLISNFKYPDGESGSLHSFVIIDIENDELEIFPFEYLCFLISSNKSKERFSYNIPIKKDRINRLKKDSHVKCNYIYDGIKEDDIIMVIGSVTKEQYDSFLSAYEDYMDKLE